MVALLFSRLPEFSEEAHSIDDAGSVIDQVSVCVCVWGEWACEWCVCGVSCRVSGVCVCGEWACEWCVCA